jgi:hypothetical protein
MASCGVTWPELRSPEEALSRFIASEAAAVEESGFEVSSQTPRSVTYERRHLSAMGFVIGLLIFPFGILVWLFYRQDESFGVTARPEEGGSVVSVQGEMPAKLSSSLAELATARRVDHELGRGPVRGEGEGRRPGPNATAPRLPDTTEMEAELEQIYAQLGAPEGLSEAKGKVHDLAEELVADGGWSEAEALVIAYRRSLEEHRRFLASRKLAAGAGG